MGLDVLYVSPHLDDAVFSAGGAIALDVRAGRRVAVATVFSRGPDGGESGERRREDRAALARLGAERIDLELPEAPARDTRFRSPRHLFDPLAAADAPLVQRVRDAVAAAAQGARVVGPLGVGHHTDHSLVHLACTRIDGELCFYEDLPYGLCGRLAARRLDELTGPDVPRGRLHDLWSIARWWAARPLLRETGLLLPLAALVVAWRQLGRQRRAAPLRLREELLDVSGAVEDKLAAIGSYTSQWPLFFPTIEGWRSALAAHARRIGSPLLVERRWHRTHEEGIDE